MVGNQEISLKCYEGRLVRCARVCLLSSWQRAPTGRLTNLLRPSRLAVNYANPPEILPSSSLETRATVVGDKHAGQPDYGFNIHQVADVVRR